MERGLNSPPSSFRRGYSHKPHAQQVLLSHRGPISNAITYTHKLDYPAYKVPCDAPLETFDYTFGDYTIKVSFLVSIYKDYIDGICTFGFSLGHQGEGKVHYILADSFMRGAYMVFDTDDDEIWMNETADCGSRIVPIGKGKDAVPVIPGCEMDVAPKPSTTITHHQLLHIGRKVTSRKKASHWSTRLFGRS
jgi:hypothetical protein